MPTGQGVGISGGDAFEHWYGRLGGIADSAQGFRRTRSYEVFIRGKKPNEMGDGGLGVRPDSAQGVDGKLARCVILEGCGEERDSSPGIRAGTRQQ